MCPDEAQAGVQGIKPIEVRQFLNKMVQEVNAERDKLPIGSVGEKRLFDQACALNKAAMTIGERRP